MAAARKNKKEFPTFPDAASSMKQDGFKIKCCYGESSMLLKLQLDVFLICKEIEDAKGRILSYLLFFW